MVVREKLLASHQTSAISGARSYEVTKRDPPGWMAQPEARAPLTRLVLARVPFHNFVVRTR
jgi:hypothetical protein